MTPSAISEMTGNIPKVNYSNQGEKSVGIKPKRERRANVVAQVVEKMIHQQQLSPGTRLPSERALAAQLGVSRPTLREALCILQAQDIINVRPGSGLYVQQSQNVYSSHVLFPANFDQDPQSWQEIFEIRLAVEPTMVARLAPELTEEQLQALQEKTVKMKQAILQGSTMETLQADADFHYILAVLSGNRLWAHLLGVFVNFLVQGRSQLLTTSGQTLPLQDHQAILDALVQQNGPLAAQLMRIHLQRGMHSLVTALKNKMQMNAEEKSN